MLENLRARWRTLISVTDSTYMPAGVRLVNPRLPTARREWREIHNRYEILMAALSLAAVWVSSIYAPPAVLVIVVFYSIYTVIGKMLGVDRASSIQVQTWRVVLNLIFSSIVLFAVYSTSKPETDPRAAGLWLILVLASLPAARYLDTRMTLIAMIVGSIALAAATLIPLLPIISWGEVLPSIAANVLWLAVLSYILRVSLVTLAARERAFTDALTTLNNVGVDQASMHAVCGEAVKRIARRSSYEYVLIVLFDEESVALSDNALEIVAVAGVSPDGLIGFRYPVGQGITGRAVQTRQPQLVNDVDKDPERRFLPHDRLPGVRAECAAPIVLGDRVLGVLDVESTHRQAFEREDIDLLQLFANQLALVLAEAQQMEIQHSLRQAMQQTLSMGDIRSMMDRLAALANQVLKADSTILYLYESTKGVWDGPYWNGDIGDPEHYQRHHLHTDSILRWLIICPEPIFARDASDVLRLAGQNSVHADTAEPVFSVRQQVRSVVATPLRAGNTPVGVMFVNYRRDRLLGKAFRGMARAFFDVGGIAALNCHLHTRARSAGRQDALADVHDGLSQIINYQIRTQLQQMAEASWLVGQPDARHAVSEIERALSTASELVRRLKDQSDYSRPMSEVLTAIARNLYGVDSSVTCEIQPAARNDRRPVRGWMVQEINFILMQAVNNAVQHAQATHISVTMGLVDSGLRVTVTDDGQGFDPDQAPSHRGLYNMRRRATKLGGLLTIETGPGRGTCLALDLPLHILLSPSTSRREPV